MNASAHPHDRPFLALGIRFVGTLVLSLIMVLVKLAALHHIPLLEIIFFRQMVPLAILVAWLGMSHNWSLVRTDRVWTHIGRSAIGIVGLILITSSNQLLPLAEATIFGFAAPIFAVILAVALLREHIGLVRGSAVLTGLVGVVFMAAGGGAHANLLGVACAVGGALCVALTAIQLRELSRSEAPLVIVFWYFLVSTAAMAPPALIAMPRFDLTQWAILLGAGFATLVGQFCLTASLRFGHVSSVIVVDYAALGWSTLWGWLIFAQLPPATAWIGAPLIVAAGLAILMREAELARRRGIAEPPQVAGPEY